MTQTLATTGTVEELPLQTPALFCGDQHSALIELCKYSFLNVTMRQLLKQKPHIFLWLFLLCI